jgi:diguanylate cyclase (GGDEF)-like protein
MLGAGGRAPPAPLSVNPTAMPPSAPPPPAVDPQLAQDLAARLDHAEQRVAAGAAAEAVAAAEACWPLLEATELTRLKGQCQLVLGWAHQYLGDMALALRCCLRARDSYRACGDAAGVARALSLGGAALSRLGDTQEALALIDEACHVAVDVEDPVVKARVWTNLGVVQEALHDFDRAVAASETALQFVQDRHAPLRRRIEANLLVFRIQAATRRHEREPGAASLEALQRQCDIVRAEMAQTADAQVLASLHAVLGDALLAQGDVAAAREALLRGLDIAASVNHHADECPMLLSLAAAETADGQRERAEPLLMRAVTLAHDRGLPETEAQGHRRLSDHHRAGGDYRRALQHFEAFHAVHARWLEAKTATRSLVLDMKLDAERARLEAEIYRLRVERLEEDKQALERRAEHWHRNAHEDALTGLANRRGFDHRMALLQVDGPAPAMRTLTLALADVDHFKQVNDRFSHAVGDQVLQAVARMMQTHCRPQDTVARFGGEEFVLAFVDADPAQARAAGERLREALVGFDWAQLQPGLAVTVSFGIAPLVPGGELHAALAAADAALYEAKRQGRNRVCMAG